MTDRINETLTPETTFFEGKRVSDMTIEELRDALVRMADLQRQDDLYLMKKAELAVRTPSTIIDDMPMTTEPAAETYTLRTKLPPMSWRDA